MSLFYFHLRTPAGLDKDEIGLECPSLDDAYLEACVTVPEMAAEIVRKSMSPMEHSFEIADADGAVLMEIPFSEVLRSARKPERPRSPAIAQSAASEADRARRLTASVHQQVETLRRSMILSQELLQRSRTITEG